MFVSGYWESRQETKEWAAARITKFLSSIGQQQQQFATWYPRARSRKAALQAPIMMDQSVIVTKLRSNHRDIDGGVIPELGFRFSAWNRANASISAHVGAYGSHVSNSVVLSMEDDRLEHDDEVYERVLNVLVESFEPEHGVVTRHDWLDQAGAKHPWDAGLYIYARDRGIERHGISFRR